MNAMQKQDGPYPHAVPRKKASLKQEWSWPDSDAQTSVIIHDRDTFKISGVSYEAVLILEHTKPNPLLWLEALARRF